jgi:hypothetical protein
VTLAAATVLAPAAPPASSVGIFCQLCCHACAVYYFNVFMDCPLFNDCMEGADSM